MTQKLNNLYEVLEKMEKDGGELLKFCLNARLFELDTVVSSLTSSRNAKHIYYFLIYIQNFPFNDLVQIKNKNLSYGTTKYNQMEEELVKEIASKLINLLIEIKSAQYIHALAKCSKKSPHFYYYLDMNVLIEGILKTNDAKWIYSFAIDILPNNIEQFAQKIMELQDAMYIYYFAKNIPNAPIDELMKAVIRTKNPQYIAMFALISTTPTNQLEKEVISLNDAESIFFFAYNIKGASIENLTKAIATTNDVKFITLFAQKVNNANLSLLVKSLMTLRAFEELVQIANQFPDYASLISSFILKTENPDIIYFCRRFENQSINEKLLAEYLFFLEEKKREEENDPFNRLLALSQAENFADAKDEFELFQSLSSNKIVEEDNQMKLILD